MKDERRDWNEEVRGKREELRNPPTESRGGWASSFFPRTSNLFIHPLAQARWSSDLAPRPGNHRDRQKHRTARSAQAKNVTKEGVRMKDERRDWNEEVRGKREELRNPPTESRGRVGFFILPSNLEPLHSSTRAGAMVLRSGAQTREPPLSVETSDGAVCAVSSPGRAVARVARGWARDVRAAIGTGEAAGVTSGASRKSTLSARRRPLV